MGYGIKIRGQLVIDPPLPWAAVKNSAMLAGPNHQADLELIIAELPHGDGFVRVATGLHDPVGESFSRHTLEEDLQTFVDQHPGQSFSGRLEMEGEEAGDLWRLKVIDGKVRRFEPTLTWPAESE
jgi:hypothetical protein